MKCSVRGHEVSSHSILYSRAVLPQPEMTHLVASSTCWRGLGRQMGATAEEKVTPRPPVLRRTRTRARSWLYGPSVLETNPI